MKRFCGVRGVSIRRWRDFWRNKFLSFFGGSYCGGISRVFVRRLKNRLIKLFIFSFYFSAKREAVRPNNKRI
jgi:hypothetical protein